ncbi:MAG: hypothetical protein ABJN35_07700 [Erythrobacter sp.]
MSQQLTISSLFSALALVSLALVARAGTVLDTAQAEPSWVQYEAVEFPESDNRAA